jgi:hypothetical protein
LLLPQLPHTAKKAHIIPGLANRSLLSVVQLVDADCSVTFDKTKVEILHNREKILEEQRNTRNGLWTVDLQDNNSRPPRDGKKGGTTRLQAHGAPQATLNPYEAHSVYECTNKRDLVRCLHAAAFSPVQDTWLKAIRAGHFATWPGLAEDLVRKHLPKEIGDGKGPLEPTSEKSPIYHNNCCHACDSNERSIR